MAAMLHAQDRLQQLLIVGFAVDRVNGRGVDDQQRRRIEIVEEASVRVSETFEIVRLDQLLVRNAATRHALQQNLRRRLQINDQIRCRRIQLERVRDLVVETELVGIEIELGEEPVFLQQEVGYTNRREHVALPNLLDLARALKQEEQLRRQRRLPPVAIEPLEERVLLRLLEYQLAREALRQPFRETRLADADRTFDDDVARSVERNGVGAWVARVAFRGRSADGIRSGLRPLVSRREAKRQRR